MTLCVHYHVMSLEGRVCFPTATRLTHRIDCSSRCAI